MSGARDWPAAMEMQQRKNRPVFSLVCVIFWLGVLELIYGIDGALI